MKKLSYWLLFSLVFSAQGVLSAPLSAVRDPGKSYTDYRSTDLYREGQWGSSVQRKARFFSSESEFKDYLSKISFSNKTEEELLEAYDWIRDLRFLTTSSAPDFKRRISWQYPDDGCFARAELATVKLQSEEFSGLKKIFIFGDLDADTPNSPDGRVTWWFHVAPIVLSQGEHYVIDPAMSPSKVLSVRDWMKLMKQDFSSAELAVCEEWSYGPDSLCEGASKVSESKVMDHQMRFLYDEWYRAKELGRQPEKVLGDQPPWSKASFKQDLNKR